MDGYLPAVFRRFGEDYPAVMEAFRALADRLHEAGPLTDRERRLAKLGTAIGRESEGGVRSHARGASVVVRLTDVIRDTGVTLDRLRAATQVARGHGGIWKVTAKLESHLSRFGKGLSGGVHAKNAEALAYVNRVLSDPDAVVRIYRLREEWRIAILSPEHGGLRFFEGGAFDTVIGV